MKEFTVRSIGRIENGDEGVFVQLDSKYGAGLQALEGFSHLNIYWWFDGFDKEQYRSILETPKPYQRAPEVMGIFATRSPVRPNLLAHSVAEIINIDVSLARIQLSYMDANDTTPVLDLKPYSPSMDRVKNPKVPNWCSHWPKSLDTSQEFNWEEEFTF